MIGRIGYVMPAIPWEREEAAPEGRHEVWCAGCKSWFKAEELVCTFCGKPRTGHNKWIRHAQLDRHLFGMQAHAAAEAAIPTRADTRR